MLRNLAAFLGDDGPSESDGSDPIERSDEAIQSRRQVFQKIADRYRDTKRKGVTMLFSASGI
jgi:hypothetical protein